MAAPATCCCSCAETEVINVPGLEGEAGSYAYSEVSAPGFNTPAALGGNEDIPCDDTGWMSVGQTVFIEGSGYYTIAAINSEFSFNGVWVDFTGQPVAPGTAVAAGAKISPSGPVNPPSVVYDSIGGGPEGVVDALRPAICYNAAGNFYFKTGAGLSNTGWVQFIIAP